MDVSDYNFDRLLPSHAKKVKSQSLQQGEMEIALVKRRINIPQIMTTGSFFCPSLKGSIIIEQRGKKEPKDCLKIVWSLRSPGRERRRGEFLEITPSSNLLAPTGFIVIWEKPQCN